MIDVRNPVCGRPPGRRPAEPEHTRWGSALTPYPEYLTGWNATGQYFFAEPIGLDNRVPRPPEAAGAGMTPDPH